MSDWEDWFQRLLTADVLIPTTVSIALAGILTVTGTSAGRWDELQAMEARLSALEQALGTPAGAGGQAALEAKLAAAEAERDRLRAEVDRPGMVAPATVTTPAANIPPEVEKRREQAKRVQRRLRELGFYRGAIDGKWGRGSQQSLTAFQMAAGVASTAYWEARTLTALESFTADQLRSPTPTVAATPTAPPRRRTEAELERAKAECMGRGEDCMRRLGFRWDTEIWRWKPVD